jgi:hypothetical protein
MKLLKKISGLFAGSDPDHKTHSCEIAVQCSRCDEIIRVRIDLINDLSAEYGEEDRETSFFCRKVVIGKENCYASIEILLKFDAGRNLVDHRITGGKLAGG